MLTNVRRTVAMPHIQWGTGPRRDPENKRYCPASIWAPLQRQPIKGMFHVKLNFTCAFYTKVMSMKMISKQSVIRTEKGFIPTSWGLARTPSSQKLLRRSSFSAQLHILSEQRTLKQVRETFFQGFKITDQNVHSESTWPWHLEREAYHQRSNQHWHPGKRGI